MRALLYAVLLCAATWAIPAVAATMETKAPYAYMIDSQTGQAMLSKQSDVPMHPSSMSKMMTLYVLFERLKEGRITLQDELPVSEKAWRTQGSKMFVKVGNKVPVENLIHGIIVQSGNDACVVVAEGLSGSEDAFAQTLNRTAAAIGLTKSHFVNSTGLPDPNHLMTSRDLATLAYHLIHDFPDYYHYFGETTFTHNGITQGNRNRLVGNDIGVDGLKTGHTEEAGYGITLSAKDPRTGRRIILVINGLESDKDRIEEGDRLLRWGLREFENKTVAKAGAPITEADVWFGQKNTVPLAAAQDVVVTLPMSGEQDTTFTLRYNGPVSAPIAKGATVGELIISPPHMDPLQIPLVAAEPVERVSGFSKIWRTLTYYFAQ